MNRLHLTNCDIPGKQPWSLRDKRQDKYLSVKISFKSSKWKYRLKGKHQKCMLVKKCATAPRPVQCRFGNTVF